MRPSQSAESYFRRFFLNSDGDTPAYFLKYRLKEDFDLNPQSKAIPRIDNWSNSEELNLTFTSFTRYWFTKS